METTHWLTLLVHALASVFMCGLIWVVQVVHYPLMARVGAAEFSTYEREHMNRILLVVGPAMVLEVLAAAAIAIHRPPGVPWWMILAGIGLLAVLWLSTALVQGPAHVRLASGYDADLIAHLVRTNWVRTLAWSARAALALAMIDASARP